MKVEFELVGQTPLLMHQGSIEHGDAVKQWQANQKAKGVKTPAGDDRSPAWTWQGYAYTDGKNVTLPAENLMVCFRQAGAKIIMQGQKTFKELTQSGMLIESEHCEFFCNGKPIEWKAIEKLRESPFEEQADAVRKLGFKLWMKRASIGQSKHVRVRPRFEAWSVRGTLLVFEEKLTKEIVDQLFRLAGRVGLGDWRPGCKTPGPFGMFEAKLEFKN